MSSKRRLTRAARKACRRFPEASAPISAAHGAAGSSQRTGIPSATCGATPLSSSASGTLGRADALVLGRLRRRGRERRDLLLRQRAAQERHRPAGREELRLVAVGALEQELALLEPADRGVERRDVDAAGGRAQALEHTLLVPLGLEPSDEPAAGVRHRLVVEVDRVLGRDHHPDPERTRLLHQRQDRLLRRWHRRRRREAHHLVEVDEGAQLARAGLSVHPGDQAREHERDHELPLLIGEMGEVDDRGARPSVLGAEQDGGVERRPTAPGGKRRRGDESVQLDRELVPVGRRHEGVDLEDAELAQRWLLNLSDQGAEIEIGSRAPVVLEQIREEDVLAAADRVGLDPDQAEQARDGALDLVPDRLLVRLPRERRRLQRADHVQRHAGLGAGRVERHLGGVAQRLDPVGADARTLQAALPELGRLLGVLVRALAGVAGGRLVDPGPEARGREVGEREREVAHVALRVEDQRRDPLGERLLEQHDPETGLARAGHPDDHGMRSQVVRVEDELAAVSELAEVEPVRHGASLPGAGRHDARDGGVRKARGCERLVADAAPPPRTGAAGRLARLPRVRGRVRRGTGLARVPRRRRPARLLLVLRRPRVRPLEPAPSLG